MTAENESGSRRPMQSSETAVPELRSGPPADNPPHGMPVRRTRAAPFSSSSRSLLNGAVGAVLAVPIVGYLLGPALKRDQEYKSWIALGSISEFPEGETRLVDYRNPVTTRCRRRDRQHRLLGAPHLRAPSSRSSPSTAHTSAARSAGSPNPSSSSAPATAAPTTQTEPRLRPT